MTAVLINRGHKNAAEEHLAPFSLQSQ
jgi:hypothetical protein